MLSTPFFFRNIQRKVITKNPSKMIILDCDPFFVDQLSKQSSIKKILYIHTMNQYSYNFIKKYKDCDWIIEETHKQFFGNYDQHDRYQPFVRKLVMNNLQNDIICHFGILNYYKFIYYHNKV